MVDIDTEAAVGGWFGDLVEFITEAHGYALSILGITEEDDFHFIHFHLLLAGRFYDFLNFFQG